MTIAAGHCAHSGRATEPGREMLRVPAVPAGDAPRPVERKGERVAEVPARPAAAAAAAARSAAVAELQHVRELEDGVY